MPLPSRSPALLTLIVPSALIVMSTAVACVPIASVAVTVSLPATIVIVLVADLLFPQRSRWQTSRIASIGVLGALIPVITLAAEEPSAIYAVTPLARSRHRPRGRPRQPAQAASA